MEQQQSSGHRPEGFCCSAIVRHDVCHYSKVAERSARRAVYAHRGAQVVLERPSDHSARRWHTFDSARSDDTDRCGTSDCIHSKREDTQQLRNRAGERRSCSPESGHTAAYGHVGTWLLLLRFPSWLRCNCSRCCCGCCCSIRCC